MSIEFILGGLFIVIIIAFVGGMVLLPQLFGISKPEENNEVKVEKLK